MTRLQQETHAMMPMTPWVVFFTQNLLVPDATEAEIQAAVGGSDAGSSTNSGTNNAGNGSVDSDASLKVNTDGDPYAGNTTDAGSGNASVAGIERQQWVKRK